MTEVLRRQGVLAGRRLVLGWRPGGRMVVTAGPDALVLMVEVGVWARAVELLERVEPPVPGAVEVVRRAMLAQADRLPDAPPLPPLGPGRFEGGGGIDWSGQR
ncbi:hypothetical protein ACFU67_13305 [Streptomyces rhizosphaericola]|uniref:hypothetical protein n=1 Tax=Streptomyces rhizosphaericola TaxID=2564098 RepID=UPI0036BC9893